MIIIGLGNPGDKYENTRHNVGFMLVEKLKSIYGTNWRSGPNYQYSDANINGTKVKLVKPMTYMNLSGEVFKFLPHDDIIVVYDDLDLPLGRLRIRKEGSAGGHNGIKSIIAYIGPNFPRIRIGIGPKPENISTADFVLSNFSVTEFEILKKVLETSIQAVEYIIEQGIDKAMNKFNSYNAMENESK
ncbi:MAG: aminoacyl-tRNA hydrolase [Fervidobacterium sp.]